MDKLRQQRFSGATEEAYSRVPQLPIVARAAEMSGAMRHGPRWQNTCTNVAKAGPEQNAGVETESRTGED
jgi:hypothetical protein